MKKVKLCVRPVPTQLDSFAYTRQSKDGVKVLRLKDCRVSPAKQVDYYNVVGIVVFGQENAQLIPPGTEHTCFYVHESDIRTGSVYNNTLPPKNSGLNTVEDIVNNPVKVHVKPYRGIAKKN